MRQRNLLINRKKMPYIFVCVFMMVLLTGCGKVEENISGSEPPQNSVSYSEFHRLVDYATVYSNGRVVFTFRNGVEVSTEI